MFALFLSVFLVILLLKFMTLNYWGNVTMLTKKEVINFGIKAVLTFILVEVV